METISSKELCEVLGVTKASLSHWHSEGCPQEGRGKWDLAAVIKWRESRKQEPSDMQEQKLKYWAAKAQREEIRAQQEAGELIPTKEAKRLWGAVLVNFVRKLETIPRKLPPLAFGRTAAEIEAITTKLIYEVRMELSDPDLTEAAIASILQKQEQSEKQKSKKAKRK